MKKVPTVRAGTATHVYIYLCNRQNIYCMSVAIPLGPCQGTIGCTPNSVPMVFIVFSGILKGL